MEAIPDVAQLLGEIKDKVDPLSVRLPTTKIPRSLGLGGGVANAPPAGETRKPLRVDIGRALSAQASANQA